MELDIDYKKQQQAEILKRLQEKNRVSMIRVAAPPDCNVGQAAQGVYTKGNAPALPVKGCSRPGGCICTYEPILNDIYP